jgi:hypothetical protein
LDDALASHVLRLGASVLLPQPCFLRATLAQRLGASAAATASLLSAHDACAALECGCGCSRSIVCCARRWRGALVRVLLVPQHCLLRATLAQRLGAGAAGPAALFAVRDACAAPGCGCCWSRSIICCARRLRSASGRVRRWRVALVRELLLSRSIVCCARRLGAGGAGPALFAARDA